MGKASRRKGADRVRETLTPEQLPAPFVPRPFEGLADEPDWVAMREIIPAATATLTLREDAWSQLGIEREGLPTEVTLATVLPMAWPGLHRADGTFFLAAQTTSSSGDASRDLGAALVALADVEAGSPINTAPRVTAGSPRLQDLLLTDAPLNVTVREGFDFWIADDVELDERGKASLDAANESIMPTVAIEGVDSAYWVRMGERCYIRWILPHDEDAATVALARLKAKGEHTLGEGTTLLGAFRAGGLLAPVFEVDPQADPQSFGAPLTELSTRLGTALKAKAALTDDEIRARDGLVSRQVTLR